MQTIDSESELSEIVPGELSLTQLKRDPFRQIEKAVAFFNASLEQQIAPKLYEEKLKLGEGVDSLLD